MRGVQVTELTGTFQVVFDCPSFLQSATTPEAAWLGSWPVQNMCFQNANNDLVCPWGGTDLCVAGRGQGIMGGTYTTGWFDCEDATRYIGFFQCGARNGTNELQDRQANIRNLYLNVK